MLLYFILLFVTSIFSIFLPKKSFRGGLKICKNSFRWHEENKKKARIFKIEIRCEPCVNDD